jgi:uncharacterized YigZ family protein
MLFSDSYLTLASASEAIFRDRGSRFIACAFPVKNEQEIKGHLNQLKELHPSAVHHCYAWRLGANKLQFRANDDGEPSGSAGKPMLGQIQSRDLTNCLVVVVRYFGGTLLGVPGLINAYKTAAAEALEKAPVIEEYIQYEYLLAYDAEDTSAVMRLLREVQAKIIENGYEERHFTRFCLRKHYVEQLHGGVQELYKTRLQLIAELA